MKLTLAVKRTRAKVRTAGSFIIVYSCLYALTTSLRPLVSLLSLTVVSFDSCLNAAIKVVVIINIQPQNKRKLANVTIPVAAGSERIYLLQK